MRTALYTDGKDAERVSQFDKNDAFRSFKISWIGNGASIMRKTDWITSKQSKSRWFWLLVMAGNLIAIYVALVWRSGDTAHLGMSVLFGAAAGSLLWENRQALVLGSSVLDKAIGLTLIGGIIWQGLGLLHGQTLAADPLNPILRLFPVISALGISLIASGIGKLKQYWQELTIFLFLGAPSVMASFLPDISPITAQFSGYLLWYCGFPVAVDDVFITLPTGVVKVYSGCSGIESMTYLLGLSVVSLILFPVSRFRQMTIPLLALLIGFGVNGIRVALMAVLAASQNQTAFDYWHEGDGSLIFGVAAVLLFWMVHQSLQQGATKPDNGET